MKKIEIIVNPEKRDELESIFENMEVGGVIISNVSGYGNQKGTVSRFRGSETKVHFLSKIKAETIVPDEKLEKIIEEILDELQTGKIGDGKVFVYEAYDAVRIRTGERGEKAL